MSWTCGACTFENPSGRTVCEMCSEKKSGTSSNLAVSSATPSLTSAAWVCPTCTLSQNSAVTRCQACDTVNPLSKVKTASTFPTGGKSNAWTCSQCTFANTRAGKCEMCGTSNGTGFGGEEDFDYQDENVYEQSRGSGDIGSSALGGGSGISGLLAGLALAGGGSGANPMEAIKKSMLDMILPALQSQLSQATIPSSEGKVDAGGVVGQVAYTVGEIKCSQCTLDPKHVQLTLDPQGRFLLTASEIALELAEFQWAYDKLNNLKFSSSGAAVCAVRGCSISVAIKLGPSMMPEVEEVKSVVKELDITIKKTKLKLLYDLLIASFKAQIKGALQSALEKATLDAIRDSTRALQ